MKEEEEEEGEENVHSMKGNRGVGGGFVERKVED